jgi:uncharacterized membrane protein
MGCASIIDMSIPYGLIADVWYISAALFAVLLLTTAAFNAPWNQLREPWRLHLYLGTCVLLMPLWLIKTAILPGLEYHFVGATLLTLMFGWRLALAGMTVLIGSAVVNGNLDWPSYALNLLVMGAVPITVSHAMLRATERWLPANFFIYIFVVAYAGAALAVGCVVLCAVTVLWLGGIYTFAQLGEKLFPLVVLLMVPEAFVTGMLITLMVVFYPGWVGTFNDQRYLRGR